MRSFRDPTGVCRSARRRLRPLALARRRAARRLAAISPGTSRCAGNLPTVYYSAPASQPVAVLPSMASVMDTLIC